MGGSQEKRKKSMDFKAAEKLTSDQNKSFKSIAFDLQAVLYTPFAGDNQIYYTKGNWQYKIL